MKSIILAAALLPVVVGQCVLGAEPSAKLKRLLAASDKQKASRLADLAERKANAQQAIQRIRSERVIDEIDRIRIKENMQGVRLLTEELEKTAASPYVMPLLYVYGKLSIGNIGEPRPPTYKSRKPIFKVFQVIDGSNMLIETGDTMTWVRGINTSGLTDGRTADLSGLFEVTGTKTYQATVGTNTVFVIEPFDNTELKQYLAALAAKKPKPKPTPSYRTWADATGKFTVEAKFGGIIAGKVILLTKDGRKLSLEPSKLSAADQAFLKEKTGK